MDCMAPWLLSYQKLPNTAAPGTSDSGTGLFINARENSELLETWVPEYISMYVWHSQILFCDSGIRFLDGCLGWGTPGSLGSTITPLASTVRYFPTVPTDAPCHEATLGYACVCSLP
jgi:hypothetical protein